MKHLDGLPKLIASHLPDIVALQGTSRPKVDGTIVSGADLVLDAVIRDYLHAQVRDPWILSEERPGTDDYPAHGWLAIVDPLDGSENFVSGLPMWGVSVSLWHDQKHIESALLLPALGASLLSGVVSPLHRSRVVEISSGIALPDLRAQMEGVPQYRVTGSAVFSLYHACIGSYARVRISNAFVWDFLGAAQLGIERGCRVVIDDVEYDGGLPDPSRHYAVEIEAPRS
jgi:myo-inositol-1(or 4)-monophosphatase